MRRGYVQNEFIYIYTHGAILNIKFHYVDRWSSSKEEYKKIGSQWLHVATAGII